MWGKYSTILKTSPGPMFMFFFYSIEVSALWDGAAHIPERYSPLSESSLEILSQTHPDVPFTNLGVSQSNQCS